MKKRLMPALLISLLVVLTLTLSGCGRVHRVIYDGNGHTGGTVPVDIEKYAPGQSVYVLGNPGNLVKQRHVFMGWNTRSDGFGTTYGENDPIEMGTENITLFAKWMYRVAYIYRPGNTDDAAAAASFETMLDSVYPTDLIDVAQIATTDFAQYCLIILGRMVRPLSAAQTTTINNTNLPVIGINAGGLDYFGQIGLYMSGSNVMPDPNCTGAVVVNAAHTIWNLPNAMNVSNGATVTIFASNTQGSTLYIGEAPSDLIHVARHTSSSSIYDTISIQGRNLYWAYYNDASCFTQDGQKLFINAINHMITN